MSARRPITKTTCCPDGTRPKARPPRQDPPPSLPARRGSEVQRTSAVSRRIDTPHRKVVVGFVTDGGERGHRPHGTTVHLPEQSSLIPHGSPKIQPSPRCHQYALHDLTPFEPRAGLGQVRLSYCTKLWFPGYVFEPVEQIERELRFRHVPGRFILVRKDQLNRPDKVRRVQPTVDFPAQPIEPPPRNFDERILRFDRRLQVYQWTIPARMKNVAG